MRKRVAIESFDPAWFCKTAALALKKGTSVAFGKDGAVYGMIPNRGGSISVFFPKEGGEEFVTAVLAKYPDGAVFPDGGVFGGPAAGKALKPYARIRISDKGESTARIDATTGVLHVRGEGVTIHSAAFGPNENPSPKMPAGVERLALPESLTPDVEKLMTACTLRDDGRPYLKRCHRVEAAGRVFLLVSDGKSAFLHEAPDVADDFSCDPAIAAPGEIAGYDAEETQNGAVVMSYALGDGTVIREGIEKFDKGRMTALVENVLADERAAFLPAAQVAEIASLVRDLGIGAGDAFGGVISFDDGSVSVLSMGKPVAEFAFAPACGAHPYKYSFEVIERAAALGGDVSCLSEGRLFCENGSTAFFAMPLAERK